MLRADARARRLAALCFGSCASLLWIEDASGQAAPLAESSEKVLQDLLAAPRYENARWGVIVCDEPTGELVLAHDARASFMTASNLKLISTACALAELGPDYRFRTELLLAGEVRAGTLHGDVILRGGGDPSFGGRFEREPNEALRTLANALIAAGIQRIHGRILGDASAQEASGFGDGWAWDYQYAWYAAPVSGLCFRENVFEAVVEWPEAAARPAWRAEPACSLFELEPLREVLEGTHSEIEFWRHPGTHRYRARGSLKRGAPALRYELAVEVPALYAAAALADELRAQGIQLRFGNSPSACVDVGRVPPAARRIALWFSPPLETLVRTTNTVSQNLYAEQLLLTAAGVSEGRRDMHAARAMFARHLRAWGGDPSECFLADGSGLSRENLVTPRAFLALLRAQLQSTHRDLFMASLPRGGQSGTLGARLRSLPEGVEVRAKTGSIALVKGLSGYLLRDGIVRRSFSILVNDTTRVDGEEVKADIDRLVAALAAEI